MLRRLTTTFFAGLALAIVSSSALAQTPVDTLPCDAWLATLSSGVTNLPDREVLYRIDGCERPDSVITAAREAGMSSLISRGEYGAANLYLSYLERDSTWVMNSYVPFVLPIITDKSKPTATRGNMMLLLAGYLQPRDAPVAAVYVTIAGVTPGSVARCQQGLVLSDRPPMLLSAGSIGTVKVAAQAMIDDTAEVPQLREAAKCLLRAANNPG